MGTKTYKKSDLINFFNSINSPFQKDPLKIVYSINFLKGVDRYISNIPINFSKVDYELYINYAINFAIAKSKTLCSNLPRTYTMTKEGDIKICVKCVNFPNYPFNVNDPRFEGSNLHIDFIDKNFNTRTSWVNRSDISQYLNTIINPIQRMQFVEFTKRFGVEYLGEVGVDDRKNGLDDLEWRYKLLYPFKEMYPNYGIE